MFRLETSAPAKINLFLRIVGRRPDGFHLLDSLMLGVSLADDLTIEGERGPHTSIVVESSDPAAPGGPANLAHRAAALFLSETGISCRLRIGIRKRIPVGSGLGGGSSDAAAVLHALNGLREVPLTPEALAALGLRIGADVPFFVNRRAARVGGIGEVVTPVPFPRQLSLVLCSAGQSVPTRRVYELVDISLTSGPGPSSIASFIEGPRSIAELLVNDLEAAVARIHPEILTVKTAMARLGAEGTLMTGSGGACFGIWPTPAGAARAAAALREQGFWAEAVRTLEAWT